MRTLLPHRTGLLITIAAMVGVLLGTHCIAPLGGGSEAGNARIIGKVGDTLGSPVANVLVTVRPSDFDPVKNDEVPNTSIDTTGPDGTYRVSVRKGSVYTIEALLPARRTRAFITEVTAKEPDNSAPQCTVKTPGTIKVMIPESADHAFGYVYIPGTSQFIFLNNAQEFVILDSVPAVMVPAVSYSSTKTEDFSVIRYNIPIETGDTMVIFNPSWKYARQLVLNTTPSGADVSGTVTDFPVLLRLNTGNFDFSQALPGGADIRFSTSDNAFLKYEIEHWDASSQQAEIWVKVDTVRGNDSMQSITMYWGNPDASNSSNGAGVFDTATGFEGVWHLGESTGNIGDATGNRFNGGRNGNQKRIPGEIGYAQSYEGSGDYTDMGNVCNLGASGFTVCAWVKPSASRGYRAIISKSIGDSPTPSYGWLVELGDDGALVVFMATDTGTWGGPKTFVLPSNVYIVDTAAWHHVAVVIDRSGNNKCRLYIDGSDVTRLPAGGDITSIGEVVNSSPLRIGSDAKGGCPWKGSLDECSLAFTVRSPDWVKLCYMNQKTNSKLVFFKKNTNK